ncbi:DUF6783 domain-containing protein [uncultured Robinsoniella sp.]|uniref:DUF6783 domain-containing protein n=1 Tax=uncultured Robinsoniella sp. TaxID=904190 RepID=UPI00374E94C9
MLKIRFAFFFAIRLSLFPLIFMKHTCSRACLIIAFWQLCVTLCGRFVPDEGHVAGYVT